MEKHIGMRKVFAQNVSRLFSRSALRKSFPSLKLFRVVRSHFLFCDSYPLTLNGELNLESCSVFQFASLLFLCGTKRASSFSSASFIRERRRVTDFGLSSQRENISYVPKVFISPSMPWKIPGKSVRSECATLLGGRQSYEYWAAYLLTNAS